MTRLFATPKLNLGLRILGRMANGYHLLQSLFFPLNEPRDELIIGSRSKPGALVVCENPDIDPEDNTLTKVWGKFSARTGDERGLNVELKKGIPAGAGLGGGSADAASLLRWLNETASAPLSEEELLDVAAATGADVPFFMQKSPALVRGFGEILEPLACQIPEFCIVFVWPGIKISSGWAYKAYDREIARAQGTDAQNSLTKPVMAVKKTIPYEEETAGFFRYGFVNDLEWPVFARYPELAALKRKFFARGAFQAGMSGSGSTIYGLFEDAGAAMRMQTELREKYKNVFFARSY